MFHNNLSFVIGSSRDLAGSQCTKARLTLLLRWDKYTKKESAMQVFLIHSITYYVLGIMTLWISVFCEGKSMER